MASIDDVRFLVVHDVKAHRDGQRLSVISTGEEQNILVHPVPVNDWKHPDGRASDLEAVCKLQGRQNEFMAAESGHWDGKYGRLFHLKLLESGTSFRASVIHAYDLPEFAAKGPGNPEGDEFEGMECVAPDPDSILILLAERGGSRVYPAGLIRWFTVNTKDNTLDWTHEGGTGITVNPPGVMNRSRHHRDITALHLDSNNVLWAVATDDAGESGPFSSYIYQVGSLTPDPAAPLQLTSNTVAENIMSGLKTEALAGPAAGIPLSRFSIATEDECLGGIWRTLK